MKYLCYQISPKMNVLLLGSGGRESAIAWKTAQSTLVDNLFIAPGNGGTSAYGTNVALNPLNFEEVEAFVEANGIEMLIVGNEDPLVVGITDYMAEHRPTLLVVGPSREGARLEGSKEFAKEFMMRHSIPTARYKAFTADTLADGLAFLEELQPPYVLKADGLAAGKGVLIEPTLEAAQASLREMLGGKFGKSSATVVIEEFLSGIECSVFVLTDGHGGYRLLPVAKDYKRVGEADTGLNTGGMGSVSPVAFADEAFMKKVEERIIRPTVDGLINDGIDYRGFIFFGLIKVGDEPMVIEYNVRMGDPETESVMLRIESDLARLMAAAAAGDLGSLPLEISPKAAATVMLVSGGYPEAYEKGHEISGLDAPLACIPFHAGTKESDGHILTSGGRVIALSAMGDNLADALEKCYAAAATVDFAKKYFRRDIGRDVMALEK